jgi:hypothetical protein
VAGCDAEIATTTSSGLTVSTASSTTTTRPPVVSSTVPTLPANAGLTLEQVQNAEITVSFDEETLTFTLVDGSYRSGQGNDPSRVKVTMSDVVAFGDLNDDGVDDAAIGIRIRGGAGGNSGNKGAYEFVVALLSQGGEPEQGGYHLVGVGARIDAMTIVDGEIVVEAKVPGAEGSSGDPKVPITATLRLPLNPDTSEVLLQTSQTSETATGDIREINVTSPEPGATVAGICVITGTVTIAPFENNLVYHVYDMDMTELGVGPLMVDAPDLGAPGTFELVIDLASLGCAGWVFVTISDLGAADGSILAMDSIDLTNLAPT